MEAGPSHAGCLPSDRQSGIGFCPYSVRERLPTSANPAQPGRLEPRSSYGPAWSRLLPVAPSVALITQRSLVQIQPPQPENSTGYGARRSPLGFSGNARLGITAENLVVRRPATQLVTDNSLRGWTNGRLVRAPSPTCRHWPRCRASAGLLATVESAGWNRIGGHGMTRRSSDGIHLTRGARRHPESRRLDQGAEVGLGWDQAATSRQRGEASRR